LVCVMLSQLCGRRLSASSASCALYHTLNSHIDPSNGERSDGCCREGFGDEARRPSSAPCVVGEMMFHTKTTTFWISPAKRSWSHEPVQDWRLCLPFFTTPNTINTSQNVAVNPQPSIEAGQWQGFRSLVIVSSHGFAIRET